MNNGEKIGTIASFTVDHDKLVPGIYISRRDGDITTYDLRTRKPNGGDYMSNLTMHSTEHMFATYIRNSKIADGVIYFGPMGCRTGFYLVVRGKTERETLDAVKDTLGKIIAHRGAVFGAHRRECGNYRCLSLSAAQKECKKYLDILNSEKEIDFGYER